MVGNGVPVEQLRHICCCGEGWADGHSQLTTRAHQIALRFAAAIQRNSFRRIKVGLYPASQLGSTPRMIEGTQLRSIQMYIARQRKMWVEKVAGIDTLSAADHATLMAKTAAIGDDIVRTRPELKAALGPVAGRGGTHAVPFRCGFAAR
jgi:hypothetical protein